MFIKPAATLGADNRIHFESIPSSVSFYPLAAAASLRSGTNTGTCNLNEAINSMITVSRDRARTHSCRSEWTGSAP